MKKLIVVIAIVVVGSSLFAPTVVTASYTVSSVFTCGAFYEQAKVASDIRGTFDAGEDFYLIVDFASLCGQGKIKVRIEGEGEGEFLENEFDFNTMGACWQTPYWFVYSGLASGNLQVTVSVKDVGGDYSEVDTIGVVVNPDYSDLTVEDIYTCGQYDLGKKEADDIRNTFESGEDIIVVPVFTQMCDTGEVKVEVTDVAGNIVLSQDGLYDTEMICWPGVDFPIIFKGFVPGNYIFKVYVRQAELSEWQFVTETEMVTVTSGSQMMKYSKVRFAGSYNQATGEFSDFRNEFHQGEAFYVLVYFAKYCGLHQINVERWSPDDKLGEDSEFYKGSIDSETRCWNNVPVWFFISSGLSEIGPHTFGAFAEGTYLGEAQVGVVQSGSPVVDTEIPANESSGSGGGGCFISSFF